ncbi:30S ribosomal protein S20 [Rhodohalobacter sp. 614A]|uniref:30S ribosomal protein S20 n=1 Tax=Rhodohalobacter sp. 614A TaxID=2908649 RepID=UPI001F1C72A3|nr:30S ribosomal protein S20 [Rhodohalobacter sp. 614A]
MPQHKSAIKRLRQSKKRRAHNNTRRSKMRTLVKKVMSASDKEQAEKSLKEAVSFIDRLAVKNIIHPNTAARKKSQLTTHVNNLS